MHGLDDCVSEATLAIRLLAVSPEKKWEPTVMTRTPILDHLRRSVARGVDAYFRTALVCVCEGVLDEKERKKSQPTDSDEHPRAGRCRLIPEEQPRPRLSSFFRGPSGTSESLCPIIV